MISRIIVKNFKRFRAETPLDLDPVTILLGANNSGKSTFLQALNLFQYCVETTRRKNNAGAAASGGEQALALENRTVGPEEFGALPVADPADLWPQGGPKGPISIRAEFECGATVGFEFALAFNRFSIKPEVREAPELGSLLSRSTIRFVPIFTGFLPREEFLTPPARQDRIRMQRHGEIVRNLLWDLHEKAAKRWGRLREILGRLFPDANLDVSFDVDVDRFINAGYRDETLGRERDVLVSGSGFHQALQIFAGVLAPDARLVLLDEPDAHLHARLQADVLRIFCELAQDEGMQFLIATHSPHLLAAAPPGSLRICQAGRAVPFATTPERIRILESLGAMDRMEIVPLLAHRAVVFVENRSDRRLIECFASKRWGPAKAKAVWDGVSFLYTYQEPVSAGVLDLARQVRDLLDAHGLGPLATSRPVRFLAIGDRDHRDAASRRGAMREIARKAKSSAFKLDLKLAIWERNEIENYLLDARAILKALDRQASDDSAWKAKRGAFEKALQDAIESLREDARQKLASRVQTEDRRLSYQTATERADAILAREWGDGTGLCDAKAVLSKLRAWLQAQKLPLRLAEEDIIDAMDEVPRDVARILSAIRVLSRIPRRPARGRG